VVGPGVAADSVGGVGVWDWGSDGMPLSWRIPTTTPMQGTPIPIRVTPIPTRNMSHPKERPWG
jgi:hypothetical protein